MATAEAVLGKPKDAIRRLSEAYQGLPDLIMLIGSWLQMTGESAQSVSDSIFNHIVSTVKERFNPIAADAIFNESKTTPLWYTKDGAYRIFQRSEINTLR